MFPAPAPVGPVIIPRHQAEQLLSASYKTWKTGTDAVKNSPQGCPIISRDTLNYLKTHWPTPSVDGKPLGPNSSRQSASTVNANSENIKKWMTGSVSGAGGTVDFHALWMSNTSIGFLFHFQVV